MANSLRSINSISTTSDKKTLSIGTLYVKSGNNHRSISLVKSGNNSNGVEQKGSFLIFPNEEPEKNRKLQPQILFKGFLFGNKIHGTGTLIDFAKDYTLTGVFDKNNQTVCGEQRFSNGTIVIGKWETTKNMVHLGKLKGHITYKANHYEWSGPVVNGVPFPDKCMYDLQPV